MQITRYIPHAILTCVTALPFSALAQSESPQLENRIWFTWERKYVNPQVCAERGHCDPISEYLTRLVETPTSDKAYQMIGSIDRMLQSQNTPVEHPEAPRICQATNPDAVLGFDPETWEMSEKLEPLRGLQGVHFDMTKLKSPMGYAGEFGPDVHNHMVTKFVDAGIPYLTKDEMDLTPGKPHLNIFFSNTNPDNGCTFSVFASLSQTMLLTRNHTIKVKSGTWGSGGGYDADFPDRSEYDAIFLVVDKFIENWQEANPDGVLPLGFVQQ